MFSGISKESSDTNLTLGKRMKTRCENAKSGSTLAARWVKKENAPRPTNLTHYFVTKVPKSAENVERRRKSNKKYRNTFKIRKIFWVWGWGMCACVYKTLADRERKKVPKIVFKIPNLGRSEGEAVAGSVRWWDPILSEHCRVAPTSGLLLYFPTHTPLPSHTHLDRTLEHAHRGRKRSGSSTATKNHDWFKPFWLGHQENGFYFDIDFVQNSFAQIFPVGHFCWFREMHVVEGVSCSLPDETTNKIKTFATLGRHDVRVKKTQNY